MRHLEDSFWLFPENVAMFSRFDFPLYVKPTRTRNIARAIPIERTRCQVWRYYRPFPRVMSKPLLIIVIRYHHHMSFVSSKLVDAKVIQTAIITALFSCSVNRWPPHTKKFRSFGMYEMKLETSFSINFEEKFFEDHTYLADSVVRKWEL